MKRPNDETEDESAWSRSRGWTSTRGPRAGDREPAAWYALQSGRVVLAFNLAKIPDHGEDSDPIVRDGRDLGLVGVFDGMGGAGGTVYETADGPRTGAYLASRVARDVVEPRMLRAARPGLEPRRTRRRPRAAAGPAAGPARRPC